MIVLDYRVFNLKFFTIDFVDNGAKDYSDAAYSARDLAVPLSFSNDIIVRRHPSTKFSRGFPTSLSRASNHYRYFFRSSVSKSSKVRKQPSSLLPTIVGKTFPGCLRECISPSSVTASVESPLVSSTWATGRRSTRWHTFRLLRASLQLLDGSSFPKRRNIPCCYYAVGVPNQQDFPPCPCLLCFS